MVRCSVRSAMPWMPRLRSETSSVLSTALITWVLRLLDSEPSAGGRTRFSSMGPTSRSANSAASTVMIGVHTERCLFWGCVGSIAKLLRRFHQD